MVDLCEGQRRKIQRLQREVKRLKRARGVPEGTLYTLETYQQGRAFLIRKHTAGDGSEIVCYPVGLDGAVTRWLQLQIGEGVEIASFASFQQVVNDARQEILAQLAAEKVP